MILPFLTTLTLNSDKVTEIAADAEIESRRAPALKGALAMGAIALAAVTARLLIQRKAR